MLSRKKFHFDILTLMLAFLLSVLCWFYVIGVKDPIISDTFYNIKVNTVGTEALYKNNSFTVMSMDQSAVNVKLSGKRSDIIKLRPEDIYVEADLSQINTAGVNTVRCNVTTPDASLTVENRAELRLLVNVDVLETKQVPVKLNYSSDLEENEIIGDNIQLYPETVKVTGAKSELDTINSVVVEPETVITESFTGDLPFYYVDANGNRLDTKFTVNDTDSIKVSIPILIQKTVPLVVHQIEGGGLTEENVKVEISPTQITIAGEKAVMEGISSITVKDLELENLTKSVTTKEIIPLDEGIVNVSHVSTATVKISLVNISNKIMIVPSSLVEIINAPADSQYTVQEQDIQLTLWGGNAVVSLVKNSNVRLVADLQGITSSGKYSVELHVGFQNLDVIPRVSENYKVTVVIN